jgi:NADH-quinone oxidoreductase subunit F
MNDLLHLPSWLDHETATLAGAIPPADTFSDSLPAFTKAISLTPLQRLQLIQEAGITECGYSGEPVHLAWRRFLRGHGNSVLVIDATIQDQHSLGPAAILDKAPWLLAEGVLIAIGLRNSQKIELLLPSGLNGHEAPFLNAVDAIRVLADISTPGRQIEVVRNSKPGVWCEGHPPDRDRLVHTPETWCRVALLFAGTPELNSSLLTLRQGFSERGLAELSKSENLRSQIEQWRGGPEIDGKDPVIVFDDGMGGFIPLSATDVSSDPLSLLSSGIVPSPSSLMVIAEGTCIVKQTRRAMYRHWLLAEGKETHVRSLLARAARLVTGITLGLGNISHLAVLDEIATELTTQGLAASWPLSSSLRYYRQQWESHARNETCPENLCLVRNPAPCHGTCPANIDIPSFMALLGNGDHQSTIEVIRQDNPFPLTCGLVCPAPCESACVRSKGNGAVFIRPMKARAAELCLAEGGYPRPSVAPDTGKKIGIIGAGPAGITAAYYLRILGHETDIFEAQEYAGGMLRYGIPAYRNPPELLEKELDQIRAVGVRIHTSSPVSNLEAFRKDYDAVFLGLGTQRTRLLTIEGVELPFVMGGIDFLRAVRSGEKVHVGPRVVVVGGGNVSIDVALTALRQGARHVDLTSLEKRRDMPASPHEIELAVAEGVQIHAGWGPVRIEEDGRFTLQYCERVKDATGKFDPVFDANRLLILEADQVILAVGQGTDLAVLGGSDVENNRGFIVADPETKMTNVPGVFAGGDGQHGPRTAVEAIRSGKIAAASIDAWLRGAEIEKETGKPVKRADVTPLNINADDRSHLRRAMMPERTVEETVGEGNYVRIEEGLTDAMSKNEAQRCLRCDICIGCGLCMAACSEMGVEALRMADTNAGRLAHLNFTRPAELCIGCGACTQVCPTGAIHFNDLDGMRQTVITGTVVCEQPLLRCSDCGEPTQTPAHREFVRHRLPDHMAAPMNRELCTSCARLRADRPLSASG